MEQYRCQPGVMRRCKIGIASGCEGTYNGDDCECAADNQVYMPPTEREELKAYRALGPVEELSALVKARDEGRVVARFAAGDTVWIIERDEDGEPCEVSGYVFLTETAGCAIVSPTINGSSDIDDIFADAVKSTTWDYNADFGVYPIADCYKTRAEAEAALGGSE